MKLSLGAFEGIYRACAPSSRKRYFAKVAEMQPMGAVVLLDIPASRAEVLVTGSWYTRIRLVATSDGGWDLAPH